MGAGGLASMVAGSLADQQVSVASVEGGPALQVGQRFGRWTITAVNPVRDGALHVGVAGAEGRPFVLEILARDPSPLAPTPPATTEGLAIFVQNGGDGGHPTEEEEGLAAMTLAHALASSGQGAALPGLLTYVERFALHHRTLMGEDLPTEPVV